MILNIIKKIFNKYDEISLEDYDESDLTSLRLRAIIEGKFRNEPCQGSLIVGSYCKGCKFERDHK